MVNPPDDVLDYFLYVCGLHQRVVDGLVFDCDDLIDVLVQSGVESSLLFNEWARREECPYRMVCYVECGVVRLELGMGH